MSVPPGGGERLSFGDAPPPPGEGEPSSLGGGWTSGGGVPCAVQCVSNARVQATPGVGSVHFWLFAIAWTRGGGGTRLCFARISTLPADLHDLLPSCLGAQNAERSGRGCTGRAAPSWYQRQPLCSVHRKGRGEVGSGYQSPPPEHQPHNPAPPPSPPFWLMYVWAYVGPSSAWTKLVHRPETRLTASWPGDVVQEAQGAAPFWHRSPAGANSTALRGSASIGLATWLH